MSVYLIIMPFALAEESELVDAAYVARLFGCSVDSVRRRKAGTKDLPRYSNRPLRFLKKDVDEFLSRPRVQGTPAQTAIKLVSKPARRRKKAA